MKDIFLYSQILVFALNVMVLIHLMSQEKMHYKAFRIALVVGITVVTLLNFGKFTWLNVVFAFTPLLTLINTRQNGKSTRFIERIRGDNRGGGQHVQNVQGGGKTLSRQKA